MDIKSLLKSLNERNVRYVIIGAFAFPFHGYLRATVDVDIFIKPTEENARSTLAALADFGYDISGITAGEILSHKLLIRQYVLETDIHPFAAGVTFEEVWQNRKKGMIEGVETNIASLDDLIRMKEAAGRDKDLQDLKILKRLKHKNQS
jgi:predicted nucleotidyltransferase